MRKRQFYLMIVLVWASAPLVGEDRQAGLSERVVPTKLEAFLTKTPNVVIERHSLGTLTDGATAQFFAVIARDPTLPEAKAKGIEIDLEDGPQRARLFADEDSLKMFQRDIENLARRKDALVKRFRERESRSWGAEVHDYANVPLATDVANTPRIGLYGNEDKHELGVFIMVLRQWRGHARYYFPGADLPTVADFVAAGRTWLAER